MSQSPVDDFSEPAIASYKQGWRALSRLLHEDRSFSGNERHCAFLNTGSEEASFADVSALTGFGFSDDGRGLATVDWDFDGDLDVWMTNRNAPRVRFLTNHTPPGQKFIAIKLRGNGRTCNRDAIGARLELTLEGVAPATRIRTLRCGEGFLSQSSNWVHFGIGKATGITSLVVKWPAGPAESFTGLQAGTFCLIQQGTGASRLFSPPEQRVVLTPREQTPLPPTGNTRTIAPAGLPLPRLEVIGENGELQPYAPDGKRPLAINIWSSICAACVAELSEWSEHRDDLAGAGLDVLTLSTDHLDGAAPPEATRAALARTSSPFPNLSISEASLKGLDFLQRSVLDRRTPLPVPSTFLVNTDGELVAFYRGPVAVNQLLQDLRLTGTEQPPDARRNAAIPFPGRWIGKAVPGQPNRVASIMADHDEVELGAAYLEHCASLLESKADDPDSRRNLGDIYYVAGLLNGLKSDRRELAIEQLSRARELMPQDVRIRLELGRQFFLAGQLHNAEQEMGKAAEINPGDLALLMDLGLMRFRLGEYEKSHEVYRNVIQATPRNGLARYHLANNEVRLRRLPEAIENYRRALARIPDLTEAANNLAWILASHPDENLRSPEEALTITTRLCQQTRERSPLYLDTHSIALANLGRFQDAIATANKAIALIPPRNAAAIDGIRGRISLYAASKPYRERGWKVED